MTNEILCTYYDCSGFDLRNDDSNISIDDSKINIDGPISISENNKVGEIDGYFSNYEFSFEVKANQLTTLSDVSITGFLTKRLLNIRRASYICHFVF